MYQTILIPLIVGFIAQALKVAIKLAKGQNFNRGILIGYGGMPSTHTAFSLSVLILIGLYEGIFSSIFAVAMVFTILIVRDALGLRRYLDEHSKAINKLVYELPDDKKNGFVTQIEKIGHTLSEVLGGAILGIILTLLLYWFLP